MGLLVLSGTSMALDDSSYEETFARSYTTTIMHYPSLCQTDEFAKSCTYFTNYYVGKFEHDYIGYITDHLDFDMYESDDFTQRESAVQKVNLDYRVIRKYGFVSVIARVVQNFKNKEAKYTEVFNISLDNQKQIQFYYRPRIPAASMSIQKYDPNVCLVDFSKNRRFHPVVNNHQSHLISFGLLIYDVWQHCLYSACSQRPMYMCYSHYYLFLVDYLLDLLLSKPEMREQSSQNTS